MSSLTLGNNTKLKNLAVEWTKYMFTVIQTIFLIQIGNYNCWKSIYKKQIFTPKWLKNNKKSPLPSTPPKIPQ